MESPAVRTAESPGLLESLWRYRFPVVAFTLLGGIVGFLLAMQQAPVYQSTSQLILADPRNTGVFGEIRAVVQDSGRYIRNQAELIRSGAVYPTAAELIDNRYHPETIAGLVTVEGRNEVDVIMITAFDFTPEGAAELANAVAEAYREVVRQQVQRTASAAITELRETNNSLRADLRSMDADVVGSAAEAERNAALGQIMENESRISQLTVDAALFDDGVEAFAPGREPLGPSQPRPRRNAAAGALLAFVVAAAYAWWRHGVTRTLERGSDPAAVLGAPLLGEIPEFSKVGVSDKIPTVSAPMSPAAEAYQFVVSALAFALDAVHGQSIVITSATPGEGKTLTSLNLAVAARKDGRSVILVDADWRMRGLTELSGVDAQAGLSNLRSDQVPFEWATSLLSLSEDVHLSLVTAGDDVDDPAGYFRTANFRRALARVKERGDLVVVDSPPILSVSETSAISSQVDGIVIVVSRGTPQRLLVEVRRRLEFVGTPVLGYIFNRSSPRSSAYGMAGDYGYGEKATAKRRRRGARSEGARAKKSSRAERSRSDKPRSDKSRSPKPRSPKPPAETGPPVHEAPAPSGQRTRAAGFSTPPPGRTRQRSSMPRENP